MSLKRVMAVVLRQFYLVRGSFSRVLPLFIWVAVDVTLWGFITRYLGSITSPGMHWVPSLLGAVLLWDFLIRVMQGITTAFLEDVWSRNFLNFFATPLSISEYVSGLVLTSVFTSLVGLVVMLLLATLCFGLSFFDYGVWLVPFLLTLFLFGIALGILGAAMVLRLGPAAEWFVWPIPALLSPFVGVFYPLSTVPAWMRAISRLLPPAYVFEGIRTLVARGTAPKGSLLLGAGLAIFYVLLACQFFSWIFRRSVQSGLMARYSAESVS